MKYLKTKNTSKFSIRDNAFASNPYGRYVMDGVGAVRLPKGTTAERPDLLAPVNAGPNGYMRYNITTDSIEAYVGGAWEVVRAPGATAITKQTLGPGDDIETTFGPLDLIPSAENNILVFVENVFQISDTNYNLLYNYLGSGNTYIQFTSSVPLGKYVTILYGFAN